MRNTLHASAANTTDKPRRLLICCYNKATNNPYKAHHHPQYTPLEKLPDEAVRKAGLAQADEESRAFLHEDEDDTTEARKAS